MLSFMIATGFLFMRTSNNSTTIMILPIGQAIIARKKRIRRRYKKFSPCSIACYCQFCLHRRDTLLGTPPNLVFVNTAQELRLIRQIFFLQIG